MKKTQKKKKIKKTWPETRPCILFNFSLCFFYLFYFFLFFCVFLKKTQIPGNRELFDKTWKKRKKKGKKKWPETRPCILFNFSLCFFTFFLLLFTFFFLFPRKRKFQEIGNFSTKRGKNAKKTWPETRLCILFNFSLCFFYLFFTFFSRFF